MRNTDLAVQQSQNLERLEQSGRLHEWVQECSVEEFDMEVLFSVLETEGLLPLNHLAVQDRIVQLYDHLAVEQGPQRSVERLGGIDRIQTADELTTARWADPVDLAGRHAYEPGDLWVGRCPITGGGLGYRRKNHVLVNAKTQNGKGATIVVPNHLLWLGSLVSIDPKGENASLSAARRGDGNDVCIGLGQKVRVLDPMNEYRGDEKYRARFNPLDALDLSGDHYVEKAASMADAIVVKPEEEKDPIWNSKAKTLIKGLILHVKTAPEFEGRRNLTTVYELAMLGDQKGAEYFAQLAADEGDPDATIDPFTVLFRMMKKNDQHGLTIPAVGGEMLTLMKNKQGTLWESFHTSLMDHMEFMESKGIQEVTAESDFDLSELKTAENGASFYLCLPFTKMETYRRWLRLMLVLIIEEHTQDDAMPACDQDTLMCLDEFETLGYLKPIDQSLSILAGYHVKLLIVTQFLQQLKKHYEKSWHNFHENMGLRIFFGVGDNTAKEVSAWLGETQVIVNAENRNASISRQAGATQTKTDGQTTGGSESHTSSDSVTNTVGENASQGVTSSLGKTASTGETTSHGVTTSHGETFSTADATTHSATEGTSISEARGVTDTVGQSHGQTTGTSEGSSEGTSVGESHGTNVSDVRGGSQSQGGSVGTNESTSTGDNIGYEGKKSYFGIEPYWRDGLRTGESVSETQGTSQGSNWNVGNSWSRTKGKTQQATRTLNHQLNRQQSHNVSHQANTSKGTSQTRSLGTTQSLTQGSSNTRTHGTSTTHGTSDTHGTSRTQGTSETHGTSETRGTSQSQSTGHTEGVTNGQTWSETASMALAQNVTSGQTVGGGISQSVHKRPLIMPHDLKREFNWRETGEPDAPGFALILIDGEHPAVVRRTLYYDDLGFDALFDRHPSHPDTDPQPLLRKGVVASRIKHDPQEHDGVLAPMFWSEPTEDQDPQGPILTVWYKSPGEKVVKGEPLYAVLPGIVEADGYDDTLTIHAPYSGTVLKHRVAAGEAFEPEVIMADVEYHIADLWDAKNHPVTDRAFERFGEGNHPSVTRFHRRQKEKLAEKLAAEEEAAALAAREAAEAEKEAKRAARRKKANDPESKRRAAERRKEREAQKEKERVAKAAVEKQKLAEWTAKKEEADRRKKEQAAQKEADRVREAERLALEKQRKEDEEKQKKQAEEAQARREKEAEERAIFIKVGLLAGLLTIAGGVVMTIIGLIRFKLWLGQADPDLPQYSYLVLEAYLSFPLACVFMLVSITRLCRAFLYTEIHHGNDRDSYKMSKFKDATIGWLFFTGATAIFGLIGTVFLLVILACVWIKDILD